MSKETAANRLKIFYMGAMLVLLIVIGIYAYRVVTVELYQAKIEAERDILLEEKARLEEELKNVSDPEYIEQQARIQLKMIYPGEVLYILPEKTEENNKNE